MAWLRKYRVLLLVCSVFLFLGVREYVVKQQGRTFGWLTPQGRELADIIARFNPEDPDTKFIQSMAAYADGDEAEFRSRIEEALAADVKHNEMMLRFYAQYLLDRGEEWRQVNEALNRWRENFPFTDQTVTMPLTRTPRTERDVFLLEQALSAVDWIDGVEVQPPIEGYPTWHARLVFRRGEEVDIREARSAVERVLSR